MPLPVRRRRRPQHGGAGESPRGRRVTWLFDLDNTLHAATDAVFAPTSAAMTRYIAEHLGIDDDAAAALRTSYWKRYGATLLGVVRHHGIAAAHFLEETHRLPGLEQHLRCHPADRAALRRLPGRKYILTNGPRRYARRVLGALRLHGLFDGVLAVEDMRMFGQHRPKPDRRMLRHVLARLALVPARCVLVEDTLANARAARHVGLRAVWMRGYLGERPPAPARGHAGRRPAYVCARINRIAALRALDTSTR